MEDPMKGQMGMQHPEGCRCGMCQGKMCGMGGCGMCSGGKCHPMFHVLRWVLGIIILIFVFSAGIMIGELKGALEATYGRNMMRTPYYGGYAYPMMQNYGAQAGQQVAPAMPAATK